MGIPYTRKSFIQAKNYTRGTHRKYKGESLAKGNQLYKEASYIYGNSCKVNAFFNKGAHRRPSLFDESSVHLKISKTIGKTKETKTTKEVNAKTIKNHRENQKKQKKQNFQTHVGQSGHGSESFVFFCFFWFSRWFLIVFPLTSLVVLVSLVFPMVFDVLKLSHCMFKSVPGNN